MSAGIRIKKLRKEKGISAIKMAADIGVSRSTISKYENQVNEPSRQLLEIISNYFDVSVDYLLGNTDIRKPKIDYDEKAIAFFEDLEANPKKMKLYEDIKDIPEEAIDKLAEYVEFIKGKSK